MIYVHRQQHAFSMETRSNHYDIRTIQQHHDWYYKEGYIQENKQWTRSGENVEVIVSTQRN